MNNTSVMIAARNLGILCGGWGVKGDERKRKGKGGEGKKYPPILGKRKKEKKRKRKRKRKKRKCEKEKVLFNQDFLKGKRKKRKKK